MKVLPNTSNAKYWIAFCSSCDLIGQLPIGLHGDVHQIKDHSQFSDTINGLLLLQKSSLLLPALIEAVSYPTITFAISSNTLC